LKDISEGFGTLPVETANGQAQLVDRLDNGVDLLGQNQTWQVEHGTDADPGANISWARRQVAELGAKSVIEFFLEERIGLINSAPGLSKLQSRPERLHAKVVLLVDHEAKGFLAIEDQAAARA